MNWLLLRGLTREARHWGRFPQQLAKSNLVGANDEVLCIDLPGTGDQNHRSSPTSIDGIVADVKDQWEAKRQSSENWHLFTISLGGMVGLEWCSKYPEDFQSLVTINTSAQGLAPWYKRLQGKAIKNIARTFLTRDLHQKQKLIIDLTSQKHKNSEELASEWADIERSKPIAVKTFIAQLYAATRFHLPGELKTPLLILSSEGDELAHPTCSVNLAKRYSCAHKIHPNAGHDLTLDDPEWVIQQMMLFNSL